MYLIRLYKPFNKDEEILLCLSLSQYLASNEVMIMRHPEFKKLRELTFKSAISSLDLLLFYLSYHRSFNVISEKFEMTMKYSFEQFYVWYQYGLSLMADQKVLLKIYIPQMFFFVFIFDLLFKAQKVLFNIQRM